jgi:dihydrofolate reductase
MIVSELTRSEMEKLRQQSRKDIWIMGGGELFRVLLAMQEVDTVEVTMIPVLLGAGVPLLPAISQRTALKLTTHKVYRSGVISLTYEIQKNS